MHLTAPHWSRSIGTGGRDASERVVTIVGMRTPRRGLRNSFTEGSMSVFARRARSSSVTLTEGARSPSLGVITNTPEFSP